MPFLPNVQCCLWVCDKKVKRKKTQLDSRCGRGRRRFTRPSPRQPAHFLASLGQATYSRLLDSGAKDADARGIGTVRYPRLVAKDEQCAKLLAARTLTNLYNQRPTWLDLTHRKLDEAVFAAYGWPPDLSDEDILARLVALNLARAPEDGPG
jgi:hypothetical protein